MDDVVAVAQAAWYQLRVTQDGSADVGHKLIGVPLLQDGAGVRYAAGWFCARRS